MMHKNEYYIVDREALPEVYGQVVEAKRLLASGKYGGHQPQFFLQI